jgi:hypothetical protein
MLFKLYILFIIYHTRLISYQSEGEREKIFLQKIVLQTTVSKALEAPKKNFFIQSCNTELLQYTKNNTIFSKVNNY